MQESIFFVLLTLMFVFLFQFHVILIYVHMYHLWTVQMYEHVINKVNEEIILLFYMFIQYMYICVSFVIFSNCIDMFLTNINKEINTEK